MYIDDFIRFGYALAAILLITGLLIIIYVKLREWRFKQINNPNTYDITDVVDALLPIIYAGIVAGEKAVVWVLDETDNRIHGIDKAAVANAVYALMPDTMQIGNVTLSRLQIEQLLPRDELAKQIENRYNQIDAFISKNQAYFMKQIDALNPNNTTK